MLAYGAREIYTEQIINDRMVPAEGHRVKLVSLRAQRKMTMWKKDFTTLWSSSVQLCFHGSLGCVCLAGLPQLASPLAFPVWPRCLASSPSKDNKEKVKRRQAAAQRLDCRVT